MKELNGRELAGFVKERQRHEVQILRSNKIHPKLVIIRNSKNPVISKYVELKKNYGEDIGVEVVDQIESNIDAVKSAITSANQDDSVHGVIVQLPLEFNTDSDTDTSSQTDLVVSEIIPEKDVDGLNHNTKDPIFYSATATAINWLLTGYDIDLSQSKIAIVGRGRLVGGPLEKMWQNSGHNVTMFEKGDDLKKLVDYNVIVTATGVPRLIKSEMVSANTVIVDAGTASENGILVGDVDDAVRGRNDIKAITPKIGGVGPLTIACLFEAVLQAANKKI